MRYAINNGTVQAPVLEPLEFYTERGRRKFNDIFGVPHHPNNLNKWNESYKNSRGIYEVVDGTFDAFALRNIGHTLALVDNKAVETIVTEDMPIADIKIRELQSLSNQLASDLSSKPRVDTGLGFFVDGGRTNKDDFKEAWEWMTDLNLSTDTIRDADNNYHEVTQADMKKIYKAIVKNGRDIYSAKWIKEAAIEAAITVQEIRDAI